MWQILPLSMWFVGTFYVDEWMNKWMNEWMNEWIPLFKCPTKNFKAVEEPPNGDTIN